MQSVIERSDIADIVEKALAGERLTLEDGVRLFDTRDTYLNDDASIGPVLL